MRVKHKGLKLVNYACLKYLQLPLGASEINKQISNFHRFWKQRKIEALCKEKKLWKIAIKVLKCLFFFYSNKLLNAHYNFLPNSLVQQVFPETTFYVSSTVLFQISIFPIILFPVLFVFSWKFYWVQYWFRILIVIIALVYKTF